MLRLRMLHARDATRSRSRDDALTPPRLSRDRSRGDREPTPDRRPAETDVPRIALDLPTKSPPLDRRVLAASAWSEDGRPTDADPRPLIDAADAASLDDGSALPPRAVWAFVYAAARAFRGGQYSTVRVAAPTRVGDPIRACAGAPPLATPDTELVVATFFDDRGGAFAYLVDAVRRTIVFCDPRAASFGGVVESSVLCLARAVDEARGRKARGVPWEKRDAFRSDVEADVADLGALASLTVAAIASGAADVREEACASKFLDYMTSDQRAVAVPARAFLRACVCREGERGPVVEFPPWMGCTRRDEVPARLAFDDAVSAAFGDGDPAHFVGAVDLAAAARVPHAPNAFARAAAGAPPDESVAVPTGLPTCYACECEGARSLAALVFPCGLGFCACHVDEAAHLFTIDPDGLRVSHPVSCECASACAECRVSTNEALAALAPFPVTRSRLARLALETARSTGRDAATEETIVAIVLDRVEVTLAARCPSCSSPFDPAVDGCAAAHCECGARFCAGCCAPFDSDDAVHAHVRFCPVLDVVRPPSTGDDALFVDPVELSIVHNVVAHARVETLLSAFPAYVVAAVRAHPRFHAAGIVRDVAVAHPTLPETSERALALRRAEALCVKSVGGGIDPAEELDLACLEQDLSDRGVWRRAYRALA